MLMVEYDYIHENIEKDMKKDISLKEISGLLSRISAEVKMLNGSGFYDINTICEDIFIPILKLVFNCPELKNMNENVDNFVAIDLGCSVSKTAFQVTSTSGSTKIIKTLNKYIENDFHHTFDNLKVFLLRDKIKYSSKRLNELAAEINFNIENDIVDLNDLFKIIQSKDIDFIDSILDILNREFKKIDRYSLARDNIELLTKNALLKVGKEKETKKYIPEVFNETTIIKDKARLFTNPYFFFPMILEKIRKLDFSIINEYFNKLEVKELSISDSVKLIMTHRDDSEESIVLIEKELNELLSFIKLFGYSVDEKHVPIKSENNDLYRLLKFAIQGEVYMLYRYLEEIIDDIKTLKSRIFLVTSKAGQGKTNFLCDFTENFCYKFNIPMVYIPARELNVISDCNIVSYIRNNRFFNEIKDKFDFFEFAESVSTKSKLPFVILIDGINEITNNVKFRQNFIDFISKSSQYDTIKVIVTCRSEFFEKQYNYFNNQELSNITYHVKDLKSELTADQSKNIVKVYLKYFNVNCSLSKEAEKALISDFLLLRIFCETNENKPHETVSNIYKVGLFSSYITNVVASSFDTRLKSHLLEILDKLVKTMLYSDDVTRVLLRDANLNDIESEIVQQLVHDDIILRRDLPLDSSVNSLLSMGQEVINFTYDELRDFIISFYIVRDVNDGGELQEILQKIEKTPSVEGVYKFTYLLAREIGSQLPIDIIEKSKLFHYIYINTIDNLDSKYYNARDNEIAMDILNSSYMNQNHTAMCYILIQTWKLI